MRALCLNLTCDQPASGISREPLSTHRPEHLWFRYQPEGGAYFMSTGMVVSVPSFLARSPMALILAFCGTTNSTIPRLFEVTE